MNDNCADDRSHIDEEWLHDRLVKLLPAQFGTLLTKAKIPVEYIASDTAELAIRANHVVRWSQLSLNNQCAVLDALAKVHPQIAPEIERRLARLRTPAAGDDRRLSELQEQYDMLLKTGDTARAAPLLEELRRLKHARRSGGQLDPGELLGSDDDGRYRLIECIGKGGFATVWKAYDRHARRFVAVKVLHAEHARDESRRERFFRGARQMARLEHAGIVRVFEPHAEDHGWHYFVMELIEGEDLDSAVRGGRVNAEQGLALVLEVADALSYAHGQGLVHRDVAPPNILVDRAGHAHLSDFDLVRAEDSVGGTRTSMLGRFIYAAPELMSRPQDADARTDVYALGMTLAFVYAAKALPLEVLTRQDAYVHSLPCPPSVRSVVARAIHHDMGERFESAATFAQALRACTAPVTQPSANPGVPPAGASDSESTALRRSRTRNARQYLAGGALAAAIVALAVTYPNWPGRDAGPATSPPSTGEQPGTPVPDWTGPAQQAATVMPQRPQPGEVWSEPSTGLRFVWIPPGEFLMGSSKTKGQPGYDADAWDDETPPRRVKISQGFWIGQTEVTNEQYGRFVTDGWRAPRYWRDRRFNAPQQPVVGVSFDDVLVYGAWATRRAGLTGELAIQLPTEAEWEFAARGEEGRRYPWGSSAPSPERAVWGMAWREDGAAPIGQRPQGATPLGVHDMAGNVWEWCLDGWRERYPSLSTVDLDPCFRASSAAPRVLRGGSWDLGATGLRCAARLRDDPGNRVLYFGFRVVCRRFRQHVDD